MFRLVYTEVFVFLIFVPGLLVNKSISFYNCCALTEMMVICISSGCISVAFWRIAALVCLSFLQFVCFTSVINNNKRLHKHTFASLSSRSGLM